jgi:hypothetical protein
MSITQDEAPARRTSQVDLEETRRRFLMAREQTAQHLLSARDLRRTPAPPQADPASPRLESD